MVAAAETTIPEEAINARIIHEISRLVRCSHSRRNCSVWAFWSLRNCSDWAAICSCVARGCASPGAQYQIWSPGAASPPPALSKPETRSVRSPTCSTTRACENCSNASTRCSRMGSFSATSNCHKSLPRLLKHYSRGLIETQAALIRGSGESWICVSLPHRKPLPDGSVSTRVVSTRPERPQSEGGGLTIAYR